MPITGLGRTMFTSQLKDRAQEEFAIYQRQRAAHMAEVDKQRDEVRQFVYSAKGEPVTRNHPPIQ